MLNHLSIISSIQSLLDATDCGTLSSTGVAFINELKIKEYESKKAYVESNHKGIIKKKYKQKKGKTIEYWWAGVNSIDGYKQITASTEERLIDKLYTFYNDSRTELKSYILSDFFEEYLKFRRCDESISSQTADYDLYNWNRFFQNSSISKMDIRRITSYEILKDFKSITKKGEYTRKAFSKAHSLLNGIFDYAMELGALEHNPSREVSLRRLSFMPAKDNSEDVYTPEERDKLMSTLQSLPKQTIYSLAVQLAACFCMRIGELRALTWEDYYPEKKKIYVHHSIAKISMNGKARSDVDVPHTKSNKEEGRRWVPVSSEAERILSELRKINGNKKYILQGSSNAKFSISENRFNEHLRQYCKLAGIPYHSSHKFRFYGITALYDAGVDERTIQYIAGHTSADMTRKYRRSEVKDISEDTIELIFG